MIKRKPITCDDVFDFFTSSRRGDVDACLANERLIEEHLAECRDCCEFARSTSSVVNTLRSAAQTLESYISDSDARGVPLIRELASQSNNAARKFEYSPNEIDVWQFAEKKSIGRTFPWQQGLLPATWLIKWTRPIGRKREFAFIQTLAMMLFCLGLSWVLAAMLRPQQTTSLQVVENSVETALVPLADGVPSEAGKRWLLGTGMELACLEPAISDASSNLAVAGSGEVNPVSPDFVEHAVTHFQPGEWPEASHSPGVQVCCSDCHYAKSAVARSTTRIAALIGQTCMICHVSSSGTGSASTIE